MGRYDRRAVIRTATAGGAAALLSRIAGAADVLHASERPFEPGALWPDDNGLPINAHGGGLLRDGAR